MSSRTLAVTPRIHAYMMEAALRDSPVLADLRRETEKLESAGMQIAPEQGQFLALLVEILGAHRYLEIGTFTGYSSLSVALALPPDGRITALDKNRDWTGVAQRYWRRAGVDSKIELRLGPGKETLDAMLAGGAAGSYDLAFIDADKVNYDVYYERCLKLLRPGGVVAIDNVLWGGAVAEPDQDDEDTVAIRELNRKIRDDMRVTCSLVPIGDGLMLCRRR